MPDATTDPRVLVAAVSYAALAVALAAGSACATGHETKSDEGARGAVVVVPPLAGAEGGGLVVGAKDRSAPATPPCAPVNEETKELAESDLRKGFTPKCPSCDLEIRFPSCATDPTAIRRVTLASGYGHAFGVSVAILDLTPSETGSATGEAWSATRLALTRTTTRPGATAWGGEAPLEVIVSHATVPAAAIRAAFAESWAALEATLSEGQPDAGHLGRWSSSSDFLVSLHAEGTTPEDRAFTGYKSSAVQLQYLGLVVARDSLWDLVSHDTTWDSGAVDNAMRALFVRELSAAASTFDAPYRWWVREAFVAAAGAGGDASLVPMLCRYAKGPAGDASIERTRVQAITSLATLTKVDRRYDAAGALRTVRDVTAEYATAPECL